MRVAKFISNAGVCSRRDAEKLILRGKVFVNNAICSHPNTNINIDDEIVVNNKIIKLEKTIRLWKMYKPTKVICSNKDPQKRKTVFDYISKDFPRIISIGRLDFMSEGLLLFTNNGDFARKIELPSSNIQRIYRICAKGIIKNETLSKINKGIKINGILYSKVKVKREKFNSSYTWIIFKLHEGKNREIRNICKFFNWEIVKLIRIQYGSFKLLKQKPGEVIEIKKFSLNL